LPYILAIGICASAGASDDHSQRLLQEPHVVPPASKDTAVGDLITLKSGKVLRGVRLLRQTARSVELEVYPGVEPLILPAKQVVSIERGKRRRFLAAVSATIAPPNTGEEDEPGDMLSAVKVSPELLEKMAKPFVTESIDFKDQDIVNILQSISILSRVSISIGPALERIPADERRITVTAREGASINSFLREALTPQFPWLRVEYQFDRIHFSARTPTYDTPDPAPIEEDNMEPRD